MFYGDSDMKYNNILSLLSPPHAPKSAIYSSTTEIFSITYLVTLLSPFVTSKVSPSAAADMAR